MIQGNFQQFYRKMYTTNLTDWEKEKGYGRFEKGENNETNLRFNAYLTVHIFPYRYTPKYLAFLFCLP